MTGRRCLAAEAAFRADAGYVAVAVPDSIAAGRRERLLEAVKLPLEDGRARRTRSRRRPARSRSGPGSAATTAAQALVRAAARREATCRSSSTPTRSSGSSRSSGRAPTVLTPHAGELGRLLGEESGWVDAHRLEAARRGAERFGCVCLLKGADTLVAAPGEGVLVVRARGAGARDRRAPATS